MNLNLNNRLQAPSNQLDRFVWSKLQVAKKVLTCSFIQFQCVYHLASSTSISFEACNSFCIYIQIVHTKSSCSLKKQLLLSNVLVNKMYVLSFFLNKQLNASYFTNINIMLYNMSLTIHEVEAFVQRAQKQATREYENARIIIIGINFWFLLLEKLNLIKPFE